MPLLVDGMKYRERWLSLGAHRLNRGRIDHRRHAG
jgi:hypothetical protein